MNRILMMATIAVLTAMIVPVSMTPANATDDGFGDSYFTAQTPSALQDSPAAETAAESEAVADSWAEDINAIEPAAGGDLFIVPPAAEQSAPLPPEERLAVPDVPILPGSIAPAVDSAE